MEEAKQSGTNVSKFSRLIWFVLILGLLIIIGISIYKRYQMIGKAEYSVNIHVIRGYDIGNNRTHSRLLNKDGEPFFWFRYMEQGGNGAPDSFAMKSSRTFDAWDIPAGVELVLYSLTDDQFYELKTQLPHQVLKEAFDEKISQVMWADKYVPLATGRRYKDLVFLLAPKGKVYVYVSGYEARLIGAYQAKPIDYDWWQDELENASYPPLIEALERGERCYQTYSVMDTDICYEILDRETAVKDYHADPYFIEEMQKISLYYDEGFFDPVEVYFKFGGRNAKLLAYQTRLLNGERFAIHKPETQTEPFHALPVTFSLLFSIEDKPYKYVLNLSGHVRGGGAYDKSAEYYQYWKDNFDLSKPIEIEVELVDEDSLNIWYKQGDKKLLSEVAYVEEHER